VLEVDPGGDQHDQDGRGDPVDDQSVGYSMDLAVTRIT
jgi:hypothetical protein